MPFDSKGPSSGCPTALVRSCTWPQPEVTGQIKGSSRAGKRTLGEQFPNRRAASTRHGLRTRTDGAASADRLVVAIAVCPCSGGHGRKRRDPMSAGPIVKGVFRLHRGHAMTHLAVRRMKLTMMGTGFAVDHGASPAPLDPIVTKREPVSQALRCPRFTTSTYW